MNDEDKDENENIFYIEFNCMDCIEQLRNAVKKEKSSTISEMLEFPKHIANNMNLMEN